MGPRFFGQYLASLDDKHRVVVPRRLREAIGEEELRGGLFLSRGMDKCAFLFPASEWESVAGMIAALDFRSFNVRMLQRLFSSEAVQADPDKLGRILLPDRLRELAGIEEECLFIGAFNRIELWNPARWGALRDAHEAQFEELAESLYQPKPERDAK
ncbi:MAG: division/cell wall cluster transcriptional repressor MraZ [Planctomycetes bacterium]|nr:division/cell wall cluster transcriptional repressor MraZ [Planctomycetota bacterium]